MGGGILPAMGELIGHIAALGRFPVKSMGGEALDEAALGWSGIVGDRQWAFVKAPAHSRFPWFTGRDHSSINAWRAMYAEGADPKLATPQVIAPDGWTGAIDDPAVVERLRRESKKDMTLLRLGRGAYDSLPLSVVSSSGHAAVEASHGMPIDPRRFRINVVVDTDLPLRVWAGRRLVLGGEDGAEIAVTAPIERCVMITIDPDTGERDPWLMRTVAQQFDNKYGMHANVVRPGMLRVGAQVLLRD